ncbi:MAG: FAD-dependent oxidoreductase [Anaerolineales bacterium]
MQPRSSIVIGGGIAGLTAASNLAGRGVHITLIERKAVLGGHALTVCCKAIDGECQLCGGCLLPPHIEAVRQSPDIDVLTETIVTQVNRVNGEFHIHLSSPQTTLDPVHADAVILATGFDHIDALSKGPYGYGAVPAVTTGEEMERHIKEEGQAAYDGRGLERVAFIQCVGSRDEHAGRGYCSQVCCRYALRLARLLKSHLPEVEITIHKMDMQTGGRDIAPAWHAAMEEGVGVVSGLPAVIEASPTDPKEGLFVYEDALTGERKEVAYDLIVLSTGMRPRADAAEVARQFGLNRGPYGFFATEADGTSTIAPGVFVTGCCQAPRSMAESVAHAKRAAQACYRYLREAL